jgi:hypothetical protein
MEHEKLQVELVGNLITAAIIGGMCRNEPPVGST